MAFGKIHSAIGNARTTAILAAAKENGIELEFVPQKNGVNATPEYLELNKLGKIPTFEGSNGFVLSECIAIAIYITSQNKSTTLLGKTPEDYANIIRWMSFANAEIPISLGRWFRPLLGLDPYDQKSVDDAEKQCLRRCQILEEHLEGKSHLVGEQITLADMFTAGIITRGFEHLFGKKWRDQHPNILRWYLTVLECPSYAAVAQKVEFRDEPVQPPAQA